MTKWIDWVATGVIVALVLMAQYELVFAGSCNLFALAVSVSLILLVRIVHQHLPKYLASKYRK